MNGGQGNIRDLLETLFFAGFVTTVTFVLAKLLLKGSFGTMLMPCPWPMSRFPHPHVPYNDTFLLMQFRLSDEFFNVRQFPRPLNVAFTPR